MPLPPVNATIVTLDDSSMALNIIYPYTNESGQCSAFNITYQGNGSDATESVVSLLEDCKESIVEIGGLGDNSWYTTEVRTLSRETETVNSRQSESIYSGGWTCKNIILDTHIIF